MEFTIVHLLADIDYFLEIVIDIQEVVEIIIILEDIHHHFQHLFLAFQRTYGVHLVKGILLQDNKVDNF